MRRTFARGEWLEAREVVNDAACSIFPIAMASIFWGPLLTRQEWRGGDVVARELDAIAREISGHWRCSARYRRLSEGVSSDKV